MTYESDIKHFGKVYTPVWIVEHMLRSLFQTGLSRVRICDPACGDGDFLSPIVQKVCEQLLASEGAEWMGLQRTLTTLTGWDVDGEAVQCCRERLSGIVRGMLGDDYPIPDWNVNQCDALDTWKQFRGSFDWVVGNPPYVRIQHLEADRRAMIRSSDWTYYSGSSDLYIVFFELGLRLLKKRGILTYISPSGWLRNDAGKVMRDRLSSEHGVQALYDFGDNQVFPGVSTYTCITRIQKELPETGTEVYRYTGDYFTNSCVLVKADSKWAVTDPASAKAIAGGGPKLRDIAKIQVGIQTLADKIFILEVVGQDEDFTMVKADGNPFPVETKAVHRILKASVMKAGRDKIDRVVIYPYNRKGKLFSEKIFRARFPLAYAWLLDNKVALLARDKGTFDPNKWFGFGREVGIRSAFGNKILTSGMNPSPNFQICNDPDTLFYSGYSIKPIHDIPLADLAGALNSQAMADYVRTFAQPFRGGWYSYAKRYIEDFPVPQRLFVRQ